VVHDDTIDIDKKIFYLFHVNIIIIFFFLQFEIWIEEVLPILLGWVFLAGLDGVAEDELGFVLDVLPRLLVRVVGSYEAIHASGTCFYWCWDVSNSFVQVFHTVIHSVLDADLESGLAYKLWVLFEDD
jgi:hypothetical protein